MAARREAKRAECPDCKKTVIPGYGPYGELFFNEDRIHGGTYRINHQNRYTMAGNALGELHEVHACPRKPAKKKVKKLKKLAKKVSR